MIKDFLDHFRIDFKENKMLFFLEVLGFIFSFGSAFYLSAFNKSSNFYLVFITYLISNFMLITASYIRKSGCQVVMYIGFIILNLFGLLKVLGA